MIRKQGGFVSRSGYARSLGFAAFCFAGCALLYAVRVAISGRFSYGYLVWNLLLALVPYLAAAIFAPLVFRIANARRRALIAVPLTLAWLVFFPNAPYLFTDFIHVFNRTFLRAAYSEWLGLTAMIWYDILMNAAFAFIGHFMGLVSLWLMRRFMRGIWGSRLSLVISAAAILLSGFGIYLGRFSRLNSWDIFFSPRRVISGIAAAGADPKALLFSTAFSLFIFLSYAALAVFKSMPESDFFSDIERG